MKMRNAECGMWNGRKQKTENDGQNSSSGFYHSAFRIPHSALLPSFRIPRSAFTLVEILASLLFLAIAVPAIVGALGVASRTAELAERSSLAGSLAENKLNEMLVDSAWQTGAQTNGDFGTDFPNYRWQMSTQAWTGDTANTGTTSANTSGTGTMTELAVEVFYPVQGSEHSVRLTTLVSPTSTTGTTNGTTTTTGASSSSSTTR